MAFEAATPEGAVCVVHPERVATSTCSRCGNFRCDECGAGGTLCPTCRDLAGLNSFPFSREAHDFNGIFSFVVDKFKPEALMLTIAALIVLGVSSVASILSNIGSTFGQFLMKDQFAIGLAVVIVSTGFGVILGSLLQGVATMGLVRICFDVVGGAKAEIPRVFSQVQRLGAFAVQYFIIVIGIVLVFGVLGGVTLGPAIAFGAFSSHSGDMSSTALAALVAGGLLFAIGVFIVVALMIPVVFAPYEIVYSGATGIEALTRSLEIGRGHRLELIGYSFVGGLLMMAAVFVGVLALCIGLIFTVPAAFAFYNMLLVAKYLALRNGLATMPPEVHETRST